MARHEEGFFPAHDNLRLFFVQDLPADEPKAFVGIVHGMGDHIGRYKATIAALNQAGFGVLGFDYRGHGQSDGRRGHVDQFPDYLEDISRFYGKLKAAANGKKLFLLGHSHGGLVTTQFLLHKKPEDLAGIILSAPYFALAFKPPFYKTAAAGMLSNLIPFLPIDAGLKFEQLSSDPDWQKETAADPLYGKKVTPRWYVEHRAAQDEILKNGAKLSWPTLMLLGKEDPITDINVSKTFFASLGAADKQVIEFPGMRHEPLSELKKDDVLREIVRWISAHL